MREKSCQTLFRYTTLGDSPVWTVRALAAETITSAGGCDFKPKVQCAKQKGEIVGKEAAFLQDCWVFGRLHKALTPAHWRALVAKYSTHQERKHGAILELLNSVKTPAPKRFRECAVLTWAIPQVAGAEGKRSAAVLPAAWYDITNWDNDGKPESTRYRWRSGIRKTLDDQVNEALTAAQELLDAEELIESCVA